jgi:hypothetical protein
MRMSDGTTVRDVAHLVLEVAPNDPHQYHKAYLWDGRFALYRVDERGIRAAQAAYTEFNPP